MDKPKLFDKSLFLPLDKCEYLPSEVITFCKKQDIRSIQSLYSLLESSPTVKTLLPEGMLEKVLAEIEKRYDTSSPPPIKRKYDALPPQNEEE